MNDTSLYFFKARLVRMVDGDTVDLDVRLGFRVQVARMRFRLWGIDTPEMKTTTLGLAREARDYAALRAGVASNDDLLRVSTRVDSRTEDKHDSFGRYLAVLYVPDGFGGFLNLNDDLIAAGHAVPYFV